MRRLFVAAVAAAGLAGALAHDSQSMSRRKTLGFGPVLPHSAYHTEPVYHTSLLRASEDPYEVARLFVDDLVRDIPGGSFQIRKDSYTDAASGVTHVYIRQYVNGIEVADGDMNLNIKDGVVLSYGDSFFRPKGAQLFSVADDVDPHGEYCEALDTQIKELLSRIDRHTPADHPDRQALHQLGRIREWNCDLAQAPEVLAKNAGFTGESDASSVDVTHALLQFMVQATPSQELAASMLEDPAQFLSDMRVTFEHHLAGDHTPTFTVDNVPEAVSPVKGRLAFVQVPVDGASVLKLVWKVMFSCDVLSYHG